MAFKSETMKRAAEYAREKMKIYDKAWGNPSKSPVENKEPTLSDKICEKIDKHDQRIHDALKSASEFAVKDLKKCMEFLESKKVPTDHQNVERIVKTMKARMNPSVTKMRDATREAIVAMDTWINTYAPELCDAEQVKLARERLTHGTLSYIAETTKKLKDALKSPSEMSLNEYGAFVDERWMGGSPENLQLRDHYIMTVGLAGEVGEVCEVLKKHVRDGNPIDKKNLTKELGDVLYYLTRIATAYGIEPQALMDANVEKINGRHERGTLHGSGNDR